MRISGIAARGLIIVCLPILLIATSLGWAVNSLWLYKYGFQKYGVSETLADSGLKLSDSELENVYTGLISYFNSDEEYISLEVIKDGEPFELFTPEETIHFKDVKGLIWLDYWLFWGTLVYILAYSGVSLFWRKRKYWRQLALTVVGGSGLTLALMMALGLGIFAGFSQIFYQFHLLFFSNEFWSAEGFMLLLFPEHFFYDVVIFCSLGIAGLAIVLGGVAGGYLLSIRSKTSS